MTAFGTSDFYSANTLFAATMWLTGSLLMDCFKRCAANTDYGGTKWRKQFNFHTRLRNLFSSAELGLDSCWLQHSFLSSSGTFECVYSCLSYETQPLWLLLMRRPLKISCRSTMYRSIWNCLVISLLNLSRASPIPGISISSTTSAIKSWIEFSEFFFMKSWGNPGIFSMSWDSSHFSIANCHILPELTRPYAGGRSFQAVYKVVIQHFCSHM